MFIQFKKNKRTLLSRVFWTMTGCTTILGSIFITFSLMVFITIFTEYHQSEEIIGADLELLRVCAFTMLLSVVIPVASAILSNMYDNKTGIKA